MCTQCAAFVETGQSSLMIKVETQTTDPILVMKGDIDHRNVGQLVCALEATINQESPRIIMDLSEVGYIDSAGIAAVYELLDRADGPKEIEMTGVSSSLHRIFQVSGLAARRGVLIDPREEDPDLKSAPIPARAERMRTVLPRTTIFPGTARSIGANPRFCREVRERRQPGCRKNLQPPSGRV